MPIQEISAAIFLGSSEFPASPAFSNAAFTHSKADFESYLRGQQPRGLGLSSDRVLDLFDSALDPGAQLKRIADFADAIRSQYPDAVRNLLVYYVGHGFFGGGGRDFYVALKSIDPEVPDSTGMRLASLGDVLRKRSKSYRLIYILDCCFAGEALRALQSGGEAAAEIAFSALRTDTPRISARLTSEPPRRGTAALCATSHDDVAMAPGGLRRTVFTDSLLDVLSSGDKELAANLTLADVSQLIWEHIKRKHRLASANLVRPVVGAPDQSEGDIAAQVPLFPNPAFAHGGEVVRALPRHRVAERAVTGDRPASPIQVPLLIGVVGHRDLVPEEMGPLREATRRYLSHLSSAFANVPLLIVSALRRGADLLVVEEALGLGLDCAAILPFPEDSYRREFTDVDDLRRFDRALAACRHRIICPPPDGGSLDDEAQRSSQYEAAARMIAADAFVLLALWDGRHSDQGGATGQIVPLRIAHRAWTDVESDPGHEKLLLNQPPALVYQIVTSRRGSLPATGLLSLQEGYRFSLNGPLESHLPASAVDIAQRTKELNRDLRKYAGVSSKRAPVDELAGGLAALPAGLREIARTYGAIDSLAIRQQRSAEAFARTSATLSFVTVFLLLSAKKESFGLMGLMSFVGLLISFSLVLALNAFSRARRWQQRYTEYRALAEGLRVEFFWALAGQIPSMGRAAVHWALVKQANVGLEWIPNAIRAAGLPLAEIRKAGIPGGIEFAIRRWVGTQNESGIGSGQLHHFWNASRLQERRADLSQKMSAAGTVIAFASIAMLTANLILEQFWHVAILSAVFTNILLWCVAIFSVTGALLVGVDRMTAARELQQRYNYLYEVFSEARYKLLATPTDEARRGILARLGRAVLAEYGELLFVYRRR